MDVAAGGADGDWGECLKALGELFQPVQEIAEVAGLAAGPPLTGVVGGGRCEISYVWWQCPRQAAARVTVGCVGERIQQIRMCDVCIGILRDGGVLCVGCGLRHALVGERSEPLTETSQGEEADG